VAVSRAADQEGHTGPIKFHCGLNVPYFIILLCLMPDDFTRQGKVLALNGLIRLSANVSG
jgi:hypothetical protein